MSYKVRLEPSARTFENQPGESLLDSALNAGLAVSYGCSNGNCGQCMARLRSGNIARTRHSDYVIREADKRAGAFLMCSMEAVGDLVVEADLTDARNSIPLQKITVKVRRFESLGQNFGQLTVQTPRSHRLRFLAGHSARLGTASGHVLLPIASCPCDDRNIQFHIGLDGRGRPLAAGLESLGDTRQIELEGPFGDFVLDRDSEQHRIMIATEAGLAPIKSIIEHSLSLTPELGIDIWILSADTPYLHNLMRSWADAFDNVSYRVLPDSACRTGRLAAALTEQPRMEADWYVAVDDPDRAAVDRLLAELGVGEQRIHRYPNTAYQLQDIQSAT